MKDSKGRTIDYMRLSITDRCNLRCKYCMPDGIQCVPRWDILSMEEIQAIAIAAADLGIRKIKVTGGEPLVRKDCCQLVAMLKSVPGIQAVTITTNGVLLDKYLKPLAEAGIDGINISLDTLNSRLYEKITGQDQLFKVLSVLNEAVKLPVSVKINAVSIDFNRMAEKGETFEEGTGWQPLVELARDLPVDVRFIEMMPVGYGRQFETINHERLLSDIKGRYPGLTEDGKVHGFGPARYYHIPGFMGSIGLISAIHGKFCRDCNRIRITSRGYLKSCLCYEDGVDLRDILRDGAKPSGTDGHYHWPMAHDPGNPAMQARLREAMEQAIWKKPEAHCFERPGDMTERDNMISIGG